MLIATVPGAVPAHAAPANGEIAEAGTLVERDLPTDWAPSTDVMLHPRIEKGAKRVAMCESWRAFRSATSTATNARSEAFVSAAQQIANQSSVFNSAGAAREAIRAARDASVKACLTSVYQKGLAKDLEADPVSGRPVDFLTVSFSPLADSSNLGDETAGYSGTLRMDLADGTTQVMLLGLLAVRHGKAVITYSFASPYDAELSPTLGAAIQSTLTRTEAALG
jgi:hypothetical protein